VCGARRPQPAPRALARRIEHHLATRSSGIGVAWPEPTPAIVEAAQTLYRTHSVNDISRSDAGAKNLQETSASVSAVIDRARQSRTRAICFVTGVPGSGKTLAGLNIATRRSDEHRDEHAVFLSGNGPLVDGGTRNPGLNHARRFMGQAY
jgi:hypothetical protein